MDVFDFFDQNKPLVRKVISGGSSNGQIVDNAPKPPNRRDEYSDSTEYAKEHITENRQQMVNVSANQFELK